MPGLPTKAFWICFAVAGGSALAADPPPLLPASPASEQVTAGAAPRPNLATPTLGGTQFWADELIFRGWRIQRQTLTDHYRLLDDQDRRRAWGSFDACRMRLEQIKQEQDLPPMTSRAVIVIHGLGAWRWMMRPMADYLQRETGDTVLLFGYPSTREPIDQHAQSLARVIERLDGVEEIDLVAYSLGNIVVRRYLAIAAERDGPAPRIRRIVMLAPPNQGSRRGALWDESRWTGRLYRSVLGQSGHGLAGGWEQTSLKLATPKCEFGILAGGRGDDEGWHPQLPGDDDGTVSVEETKLAGANDFRVLPIRHPFFARNPEAMRLTLRFLNDGCFETAETRTALQDIPLTAQRTEDSRLC